MSKRILHVSFHPEAKPPAEDVLVAVLNRAPDWVEYAPSRWLLWTSVSTKTWYARFRQVAGKDGALLIFSADFSEYDGYLSQRVWDWLRKYVPQEARSENEQV
jgi:hypothetical protein